MSSVFIRLWTVGGIKPFVLILQEIIMVIICHEVEEECNVSYTLPKDSRNGFD